MKPLHSLIGKHNIKNASTDTSQEKRFYEFQQVMSKEGFDLDFCPQTLGLVRAYWKGTSHFLSNVAFTIYVDSNCVVTHTVWSHKVLQQRYEDIVKNVFR